MRKKYTSFGFSFPLSQIRKNQQVQILSIPNAAVRNAALRIGMTEGSCIRCISKIRNGPIILLVSNQQVAVGYHLAQNIKIAPFKSPYVRQGGF